MNGFFGHRFIEDVKLVQGVLTKPPGGKRDMKTIQDAFNLWSAQSGRDLTAISRALAMTVVEDAPPPSKYYTSNLR